VPTKIAFDKNAHRTTDPTSIWVIVNKQHPLQPKTYVPSLVVPTVAMRSGISSDERQVSSLMAPDLEAMIRAASQDKVAINLQSGYRSYNFQVTLYGGYVTQLGKAEADRQSARPGYSEHQTGLAADLGGTSKPSCNIQECFSTTVEGAWL